SLRQATPEDGGHAASGGGTFPQPLVGGLVRGSPPPAAVRRRFPLPPLFARLCRASAAVPSPNLRLGDWSVVPRLRRRYGDVSPYPRSSPGCAGLRRRCL